MEQKDLTRSACAYGALRRTMRGVGQLYDRALAPAGLNAAQYNLLRTIQKLGTPTQSQLAADLVMDLSALGHTLKPLIRDGWVTLNKDEIDGRRRLVSLTDAGTSKVDEAQRLWKPAQRRFETLIGPGPTKEFLTLLDHLASNAFGEAFFD